MKERTPVYEGIKQALKNRIESGELKAGDRIPSENQLAREFGVNRSQTRPALRELQIEGYLIRKQGSGSYVAPLSGRTPTVKVSGERTVTALVVPQEIYGHANNVIQGFAHRMAEAKQQVITYNLNLRRPDDGSERECLQSVVESGVAGIAAWVVNGDGRTRDYICELAGQHFPIVLVDRYLPDVDTDFAVTDNKKLGYGLTAALLSKGHKRIGFVGTECAKISSVEDRLDGYSQALKEAGVPFDERFVMDIETMKSAVTAAMALRERLTAFVCTFEEPLNLLVEHLTALGYGIPGDVDVALVSDCPERLPAIPAIRAPQDGWAIGTKGAELLLARIDDPQRAPERCVVSPGAILG